MARQHNSGCLPASGKQTEKHQLPASAPTPSRLVVPNSPAGFKGGNIATGIPRTPDPMEKFPEVSGQHEPSGKEPVRQHIGFAASEVGGLPWPN